MSPDLTSLKKKYQTMPFWIETVKSNCLETTTVLVDRVVLESFNIEQKLTYDIVKCIAAQQTCQLLMIITGQAGSGKSYVIKCTFRIFFGGRVASRVPWGWRDSY